MRIEWDEAKNRENERKHGISFSQASALFSSGVDYLEIFDEAHSTSEDRFIAVGPLAGGDLAIVIWTDPDEETVRIISARWATRGEQALFASHMEERR